MVLGCLNRAKIWKHHTVLGKSVHEEINYSLDQINYLNIKKGHTSALKHPNKFSTYLRHWLCTVWRHSVSYTLLNLPQLSALQWCLYSELEQENIISSSCDQQHQHIQFAEKKYIRETKTKAPAAQVRYWNRWGEKPSKGAQSCATSNNRAKSSIHPQAVKFVSKEKHENDKMLEIMAIRDTI